VRRLCIGARVHCLRRAPGDTSHSSGGVPTFPAPSSAIGVLALCDGRSRTRPGLCLESGPPGPSAVSHPLVHSPDTASAPLPLLRTAKPHAASSPPASVPSVVPTELREALLPALFLSIPSSFAVPLSACSRLAQALARVIGAEGGGMSPHEGLRGLFPSMKPRLCGPNRSQGLSEPPQAGNT